jgi:hypothetical protein
MRRAVFQAKGSLGNHGNHVLHTHLYMNNLICGGEASQIISNSNRGICFLVTLVTWLPIHIPYSSNPSISVCSSISGGKAYA